MLIMIKQRIWVVSSHLPDGLAVRIPGFHPGGPGSTPGRGAPFASSASPLVFLPRPQYITKVKTSWPKCQPHSLRLAIVHAWKSTFGSINSVIFVFHKCCQVEIVKEREREVKNYWAFLSIYLVRQVENSLTGSFTGDCRRIKGGWYFSMAAGTHSWTCLLKNAKVHDME